ncbi:MAG: flagellar assembly protein FliW [Verrucomicrobiia bacterium]|jgi:flagellar assembly factor FliW
METTSAEPKPISKATRSRDKTILRFPVGLLGFENLKKFSLVGRPQEEPFLWLEVQDESGIAFLVVPPDRVTVGYQPNLTAADVEFLDLKDPREALLFCIVTLRGNGRPTVNLKGPIVINARTRIGKQVVPNNASEYSTQYSLPVTA